MDIPKPNFVSSYPIPFCGCSCFNQPKERNTDCYFYEDVQDMGAHIPTCNYHKQLGYCPCENCKKYIKYSDVSKVVRKYVDKKSD